MEVLALLLVLVLAQGLLPAQSPRNFLQRAFGTASPGEQPLLSPLAPGFNLTVASREFDIQRTGQSNIARLTVAGIPVRFEMRYERQAGIDLYPLTITSPTGDPSFMTARTIWQWARNWTARRGLTGQGIQAVLASHRNEDTPSECRLTRSPAPPARPKGASRTPAREPLRVWMAR